MRATVLHAPRDIRLDAVPDPAIHTPTDATVRVVATCVCGSDLWPYRGITGGRRPERIGHELVGIVEEVGSAVRSVRPGQFVIAPFKISDGTCVNCRNGVHTSCLHGAWFGSTDEDGFPTDGGQGEYVRLPHADGTLVALAELPDEARACPSDALRRDGNRAPRGGLRGSGPGLDGSRSSETARWGQCAVIAATRLGAERIVIMSRHADRQALAQSFGATDVVGRTRRGRRRPSSRAVRRRRCRRGARVCRHQGVNGAGTCGDEARRPGRLCRRPNGGPELPVRPLFEPTSPWAAAWPPYAPISMSCWPMC